MRPDRSYRAPLAAALAISLSSCGLLAGGEEQGGGFPPALVEVSEVRSGALMDTWTLLGDVRALERAELAAGASGQVSVVNVREGDGAAAGELLLEVDTALASPRWSAARAAADAGREELTQARRDLDRLERVKADVLAASELERARTAVAAQEARQSGLDAAQRLAAAELERHRVRAPFQGTVSARHVDPGDWVTPGEPVLDLVSTESVEVHVHAPPELARVVRNGDRVLLSASPGVPGTVVGVVPALDPVERTVLVRVAPVEPSASLLPGAPVDVAFDVPRSGEDAVLVPRDALILGPVDNKVALVVDDAANLVDVETLATTGSQALVRGEGVVPGALVVVRGNERLQPGQPVTVAARREWPQD